MKRMIMTYLLVLWKVPFRQHMTSSGAGGLWICCLQTNNMVQVIDNFLFMEIIWSLSENHLIDKLERYIEEMWNM